MTNVAVEVPDTQLLTREMYIELLKKCLTGLGHSGSLGKVLPQRGTLKRAVIDVAQRTLARRRITLAKLPPEHGGQEPNPQTSGETMMGIQRLNSLQRCVEDVLRDKVQGDFIETGVWRGGAVIFMRAMLKVYGEAQRSVWVADSFQGVPKPDSEHYPQDSGDQHWKSDYLAVSLAEVEANFARYGLLDHQVRFLPGWFRDTLPTAPIRELAVLRLDGDIYESTAEALHYLYPKLSCGGYTIVDDYGAINGCKSAVDDYRSRNQITEPMELVNDRQRSCVYWRRIR